jgi:hypothetical protein
MVSLVPRSFHATKMDFKAAVHQTNISTEERREAKVKITPRRIGVDAIGEMMELLVSHGAISSTACPIMGCISIGGCTATGGGAGSSPPH